LIKIAGCGIKKPLPLTEEGINKSIKEGEERVEALYPFFMIL
jgi:hypothetical protein